MNRLLKRIGIDSRQYFTLVKISLIMDFRTTEARESGFQMSLILFLFFAALLSFSVTYLVMDVSLFSFCLVTLSFSMMMMVFPMIEEFGRIIANPDNYVVLAPRPISSRTYFFVKMTHICIYLLILSICLSLPPTILGIFHQGSYPFFPVIYFATSLLAALFVAEFVIGLYGSLIRALSGQTLRKALIYWQLAISVMSALFTCFVSLKLLGGLKLKMDFLEISGESKWLYVMPSGWFVGMIQFVHGDLRTLTLLLVGLALIMPLLLAYFLFRNISLHYAQRLLSINDSPKNRKAADTSGLNIRRLDWILKRFLSSPESLAAFSLVSGYLRRDADTRMRIYSLMGPPAMSIIFMAMISTKRAEGLSPAIAPVAFMALCFIIHSTIEMLKYSKEWRAGWILGVASIESVGEFFKGVRAAIVRWLLPFFMIQCLACLVAGILGRTILGMLSVFMGRIILGMLSAFIGAWCYLSFRSRFHAHFPFSHEPRMMRPFPIGPLIVMMGIGVVFGGIHFFCFRHRILYVPLLLFEVFLLIVLERHNKKQFDQLGKRGLIKVPGNS